MVKKKEAARWRAVVPESRERRRRRRQRQFFAFSFFVNPPVDGQKVKLGITTILHPTRVVCRFHSVVEHSRTAAAYGSASMSTRHDLPARVIRRRRRQRQQGASEWVIVGYNLRIAQGGRILSISSRPHTRGQNMSGGDSIGRHYSHL